MKGKGQSIHYFDCAATTPVRREVLKLMMPFFSESFGNPSNLDALGHRSKIAINDSLDKISAVLNCRVHPHTQSLSVGASEFVFTGSATEADNLAILGTARANKKYGNKIIISNIEHKGIIAAAEQLAREGFEIVEVKVRPDGLIYPEDLAKLIDEKTILISITSADNETGTIQPIAKLVKTTRESRIMNHESRIPYFHTDASQIAGYLDLDVQKLGVDLLTLSAHKICGPKGIGGLYIRRGTVIRPIIFGGGQQSGVRSGTENVPGIVGFGEALWLVHNEKDSECARVAKLRDRLTMGIFSKIQKVILNGHPTNRLPNFLNVSILDIEGEAAVLYLDKENIIVNTGSACNSQLLEPSHILTALGRPYEFAHGSVRFTLGKYTTIADVDYVLKKLPLVVRKLRQMSPINLNPNFSEKTSQPKAFVGDQTPHFFAKK
ncbi:MAG: aminotransferase class V-fold PLP-dependent enzyme [Minisyncoccia bacterium]